jgi:hypothetical protein
MSPSGASRRQLDEVDAAVWSGKKSPDIWPFVIGGVVPDDMNDALFGVAGLNFGKKLRRADPVDGGWLDKGRIVRKSAARTYQKIWQAVGQVCDLFTDEE